MEHFAHKEELKLLRNYRWAKSQIRRDSGWTCEGEFLIHVSDELATMGTGDEFTEGDLVLHSL